VSFDFPSVCLIDATQVCLLSSILFFSCIPVHVPSWYVRALVQSSLCLHSCCLWGRTHFAVGANFSALDFTLVCGTDLDLHLLLDSLSALMLCLSLRSGNQVITLWSMTCLMTLLFDADYSLCLNFLQWNSSLTGIGTLCWYPGFCIHFFCPIVIKTQLSSACWQFLFGSWVWMRLSLLFPTLSYVDGS